VVNIDLASKGERPIASSGSDVMTGKRERERERERAL